MSHYTCPSCDETIFVGFSSTTPACNCDESKSVKQRIIDLLEKQNAKGVEKYGHTLDDCPDDKYDWKLMAMEEMIDLLQYQQKEIIRLERLLNP